MALSLGPAFSGVIFPIAIAVGDFLEALAWAIEQWEGLWSAFDRTRFVSAGALWQAIAGNDLQQLIQELLLSFTGARKGSSPYISHLS